MINWLIVSVFALLIYWTIETRLREQAQAIGELKNEIEKLKDSISPKTAKNIYP